MAEDSREKDNTQIKVKGTVISEESDAFIAKDDKEDDKKDNKKDDKEDDKKDDKEGDKQDKLTPVNLPTDKFKAQDKITDATDKFKDLVVKVEGTAIPEELALVVKVEGTAISDKATTHTLSKDNNTANNDVTNEYFALDQHTMYKKLFRKIQIDPG